MTSFVQKWVAYKTFRLTELSLSGFGFDVKEAFELLAECAQVGLLNRLKGSVFPKAQVKPAVTTVTPTTDLNSAYNAADGKVMWVEGEAPKGQPKGQISYGSAYGSNPYYCNSSLGQCMMHHAGKAEGAVLLLPVEQKMYTGSMRHGVTSGQSGNGTNQLMGYRLLIF